MRVLHVVAETPLSFLQHLKDITYIERRPLRWVSISVALVKRVTDRAVRQVLRGAPAVARPHLGAQPPGRVFFPAEGR